MYGLSQSVAPTAEPLTLSEAKKWLRMDEISDDDEVINDLITEARLWVERVTGRQLVTATWVMTLDGFPYPTGWDTVAGGVVFPDPRTIRIPKAPLQSVTSIQYYDYGNTLRTLGTSVYQVDATKDPGVITLEQDQTWPVTRLRPGAVRITFVAGYGAASAVPKDIKLAMKFCLTSWYEERGSGTPPEVAKALLSAAWNGELEYGHG